MKQFDNDILKHFQIDHSASIFRFHCETFDNDWFWNTSTLFTLLPFLGCHFEKLWQWLFWNTSTLITLLPFFRLSLWNTFDNDCFETLPHWSLCYPYLGCDLKHFDNDCFETLPQWSLCYPFLGCHFETLWQWLFWNTFHIDHFASFWGGCLCETRSQWLFGNISTWITLLPFFRLSLWNTLTMTVLKHFHMDHFATLVRLSLWNTLTMIVLKHFHIDHCYPFSGCHCETLWQWLFWNISTLITLLPFFRLSLWNFANDWFETFPHWSLYFPFSRLSLWNTWTMTVLKHFHLDHFATLFQIVTVKNFDNNCFETLPQWPLCYPLFKVVTVKHFDNDCFETFPLWSLFPFFRLSLWNTLTMTVLKHFHLNHFVPFWGCRCETLWQWLFWNISTLITATLFQVVTLKHLHNDSFETLPQWSLCNPFPDCHCETLWQWLFWNTSTMITLLPVFRVVTLKHFDNDCFETFPHWSLCYPFLGCHFETLWQWLFWNTSTMITLLPFSRLSLWNTLTMTVLKHFHNDHIATRF